MDATTDEQGNDGQLDDIQNYLTDFNKGIAGPEDGHAGDQSDLYDMPTINGTDGGHDDSSPGTNSQPQNTQAGHVTMQMVDTSGNVTISSPTESTVLAMGAPGDVNQMALEQMQGQQLVLDSAQQGITVLDAAQVLAQQQVQPQILQQQVIQQGMTTQTVSVGGVPQTLVFQPVVNQAVGQDIAQVAAAVSQTMPAVTQMTQTQVVNQAAGGTGMTVLSIPQTAHQTGILEAAAQHSMVTTAGQIMTVSQAAQQSNSEPTVTMVQGQDAKEQEEDPEQEDEIETKMEQVEAKKEQEDGQPPEPGEIVPAEDEEEDDEGETQMVHGQVEQVDHGSSAATTQEGDGFQTVTLVPSDMNQGGEVSYVLIVSQGDEQNKGDDKMDMSVYDFQEEGRNLGQAVDEGDEPREQKVKVVKVQPKKPQPMSGGQLMCNYCNYTSTKRYLLTRHMKSHSEERPHKCNICDRSFKTIASLQNHINTHTGTRPHKCKECDAAFTTSGELVRHVRYRHTFEKPHKCPECDYASVELSKLKRHIRSHTGERPYQCPHCSYASPDTYKLKRHLRVHTGEKPYECEVCHARFTQSNSLKAHRLIHSGDKPIYQCDLCPTTCGRKTDLKIHIQKLHTSEKPLACRKCGKSFPDRYTYKLHLKTHDGEKCFRCELCPYAALSQRHLESHILTHTGEKPYQCDECDQAFRQKQLLKRHKNLYHTPDYVPPAPKDKAYECAECRKTFAHKGNLLRHMAMHDPDHRLNQEMLESQQTQEVVITDNTDQNTILVTTPMEETPKTTKTTDIPVQTVQLVQVIDESGQNTTQILLQMDEGPHQVIDSSNLANSLQDEDSDDEPLAVKKEEMAMEIQSPPSKKRGRGRPRKSQEVTPVVVPPSLEPEMEEDELPEEELEEEEEEEEEETPEPVTPPRKATRAQVVKQATPKASPRGRGRPRRIVPDEPVLEDSPEDISPRTRSTRKRGISENEFETEEVVSPRKKVRGGKKSQAKGKKSQAEQAEPPAQHDIATMVKEFLEEYMKLYV